ncbi:MAG: hypothetical protein ACFCVK_26020 [Acidimicrobiales bacterium]
MLSTKPIDASQLTFRYSGTAEHYEYDRETEKRAKDQTRHLDTGYPLWKVRCVAVYRAGGEHGEITVTVPSKEAPVADFDAEIMFSSLVVKDLAINGNQGQTWQAQSFAALDARPSQTPMPTPTAAKKTDG